MAALAQASPPPARLAPGVIGPAIVELGTSRDGEVTFIAHGYAATSAGMSSLGGVVGADFAVRLGGYCLEGADARIVPTGVSANTTAWSYTLNSVKVVLVEDAPKGSCKYTARVSYELSVTGAISINQMEYTLYLKGRAVPDATAGRLTAIP